MRVCDIRSGISISVSAADRRRLETIVADRNTPQKHVWHARIVLLTADSLGTNGIVAATGKSKTTIWRWQERFMDAGVEGSCRTRRARPKPPIDAARVAEVVRRTRRRTGRRGRWPRPAAWPSRRSRASGRHGLAPHRWRNFKLSTDPTFAEKLHDIVELYVDPPAHAVC